ncbi:FG-GAP-like repeat-containing protein [Embleya sp. NPDC059237]|uniref:FG-GAP-like repeat-containing protein n=1 Tax=Embleya sp. NPDC059237 TaxID=3346784 RepID=UPI00367E5525
MITAALSAGLITAMPAGAASTTPATRVDKETPAGAKSAPAKQADDQAAAAAEAKKTGRRVEVVSLRTETDEVWANPSGTFTSERALSPVRVWRDGTLVKADDTLAARKDGRLAPRAARIGMSFSAGGNGPLAELAKNDRRIALTWPGTLPKPIVEGDSATYPEVLPGVDLKVVANVDDFAHYVIIKTPEAGRNPALATLKFGLKTTGLDITRDESGELRALDPTGQAVFTAPKPQMWEAGANPTAGQDPAARALTAEGPTTTAPTDPTDGYDPGAKHADLGVKLTGQTLELSTDQALLTAPDTKFPVVVDPVWRDDWKFAWALAYKHNAIAGSATTSYWNGGTMQEKVGRVGCAKDGDRGGAVVCAKTFFQVGMTELWDKQIINSVLRLQQSYAGAWNCRSGELEVWDTGSISKATTWNNQPSWDRRVGSIDESYGGRNCPGANDTIEINVTSAIDQAARSHWGSWTLGLKSQNDTIDVSWRKFKPDSVRISTEYNTPPQTPANRATDPSTPCTGGIIGRTDQVVLFARADDAEDNNLTAEFHYWKDGSTDGPTKVYRDISRGTVARAEIPASALDGTYRWDVRIFDGRVFSPWAGQCLFTVDGSRPAELPGVSSPQFPAGNPDQAAQVRTPGDFTFTANGVADVTRYQWWTESDPKVRDVPATSVGGPATISFTPTVAGSNYLYVRSLDAAGNRSDVRNYLYYAKRSPNRDNPGDLNGDGHTDLMNIDPGSGKLLTRPGQGNGTFGATLPVAGSFADVRSLTHRGTWTADYYEDLVTLRPAPDGLRNRLYVYPGRGDGSLESADSQRRELRVRDRETNDHWADADQIVSIGSVNDDDGNGVIDEADYPDLLVKTGSALWLYLGSPTGFIDTRGDAIALGNADWQNMTLMSPGDLNGDKLPEIWSRDTASGRIHQYTSRAKPAPGPDGDGNPTALDLTVYGDPAVRAGAIGTGFTGTAYPHLTSDGDLEKDGFADLWSRDGEGRIVEFPGRALSNGSAFGPARQLALGSTPWSECESFESAATGRHELCGPVLAKFRAAGGVATGYPAIDMSIAPDGIGRYAHFKTPNRLDWSIYWHPATGATLIGGGIRLKWAELGWETSILGYPTADDTLVGIGEAWFNTFQGDGGYGAIYWTPEYGTWSIHGNIYTKYLALGGPAALGFPTTDESDVPGNTGRYNHFRKLSDAADSASIYWNGTTNEAWSVKGWIRTRWSQLSWEQGWLGYPTSDEFTVANGDIRESFQGGYVRFNAVTGITAEHHPDDRTAHLRTDLTGDFNGDGRADMLTVYDHGEETSALYTLLARPTGGYEPPRNAWTAHHGWFSYQHSKWTTGDFNGDGKTDVAALYGYPNGSNRLFTFLSKADGTFTEGLDSAYVAAGNWTANNARFLSGDFNGDGRADTAMIYDQGGNSIGTYTWIAKPDGTFNDPLTGWRAAPNTWDANSAKYVTGDFNGDGRADIAAMYGWSDASVTLHTLLTDPTGVFTAPLQSWRATPYNWDWTRVKLTAGDYNGDGKADVAAMYRYDNDRAALFTFAAKTDGSGGFGNDVKSWDTPENWWASGYAGQPVSGDHDNDGRADISIMYNYGNGATTAYVFKARPDGGFDGSFPAWQTAPGTW